MLVGLYEEPEKPGNAVDFIKKCLGAPSDTDVEALRAENDELKNEEDREKRLSPISPLLMLNRKQALCKNDQGHMILFIAASMIPLQEREIEVA